MSSFRGRNEVVDVCRRSSGRMWSRKSTPPGDGLALEIIHSVPGKTSLPNQHLVRFLHLCFDDSGSRLLAADLQGTIFLFNLAANTFSRILCFGSACTAVAFSRRGVDEVLVATADASLKIINVVTKEIVACLKGHVDPVQTISVHHSGRYVVTSSEDTAQLWDLNTLERKRKLTIKNSPGVLKVFFIHPTNDIITSFRDDSIFCWDAESLTCKFQLPSTSSPGEASPLYRDVAADGRHLVAGGRNDTIAIFSLESKSMLRVAQLPNKLASSVKKLAFLPSTLSQSTSEEASSSISSSLVLVLSHGGSLLLLDIHSCKIVVIFEATEKPDRERIKDFTISPTGRHLIVCTDTVKLYLFDKLLSTITQKPLKSKAPPPTVSSRCKGRLMTPSSKHVTVSTKTSRKMEEELERIETAEPLTPAKLRHILDTFGQFPSKYRLFIWRMILKLPENHQAFASLVDKGTHPSFQNLRETYPVKDQRLFRALQKTLSHLAHWAPICGESPIIPLIAFPFVKLFVHNQLLSFEVVASVILNHLQHFFEFFPNPPVNILAACENLLCFHAPTLLEHFAANSVSAVVYAWPLLETLFSEILTANDWLNFFDFAHTSHPSFILFAVVAYSILNKSALMACNYKNDLTFFYRHHSAVSVASLVSLTERLASSTPSKIHPAKNGFFENYTPLPDQQYPIFNGYPEMIVNFQIKEKDRLSKENEEVERQEGIVRDIERRAASRHIKDHSFRLPKDTNRASKTEMRRILRLGSSASDAELQRKQIQDAMEQVQRTEMQLLNVTRKKLLLAGPASLQDASETLPKQPVNEADKENLVSYAPDASATPFQHAPDASATPSQHGLSSNASSADDVAFAREGRETFEARQRELVKHIQTLRAKLASSSGSRLANSQNEKVIEGRGVENGVQLADNQQTVENRGIDIGGAGDFGGAVLPPLAKNPYTSPFTCVGGGDAR